VAPTTAAWIGECEGADYSLLEHEGLLAVVGIDQAGVVSIEYRAIVLETETGFGLCERGARSHAVFERVVPAARSREGSRFVGA